jgi:hypothetical protein
MLPVREAQIYRMYRHIHFHNIQDCLHAGRDESWGILVVYHTEIQDLECRMCLKRITDGVNDARCQQSKNNTAKLQ